MDAAIAQARKSLSEGGIPIGSALARHGELLAVGHNKRVQENDPVTHAEIDCLRHAGRLGNFRDTVLYSTLMLYATKHLHFATKDAAAIMGEEP